jgi:hypothetical protein
MRIILLVLNFWIRGKRFEGQEEKGGLGGNTRRRDVQVARVHTVNGHSPPDWED